MEASMKNFELKVHILRKFQSQGNFCQAIGLSESRLSRLIHGRTLPNPAEVQRIAEALGAEPGEIFPIIFSK
jgi:transcriptional regulator with XRE-family HTH domain